MKIILKKVLSFFLSKKFYGPIIAIVLGIVLYQIVSNFNNKVNLRSKKIRKNDKNLKKRETVVNLLNNIIKYIIIVIVALVILEIYGVNTTSILASLGIIGLVVGLAFQDTMKNMLSGILIIFDDRYNVGDTVKINDFTGEVISLGLQTTKLKDFNGDIFTINNSSITSVINYTECDSVLFLDIPVSYNTNIKELEKVLTKLKKKVLDIENVKEELNLLGIESFNSSDISYRVSLITKPYKYFNVKRQFFKMIKETFDKEGIEIPFNQIDVHIK